MEVLGDTTGYRLRGVEVARSPIQRFRGLMGRSAVPLLLTTNRVHGFWLKESVWLVGLGPDWRVCEVRRLRRRRLAHLPQATWILEIPLEAPLPEVGDRLAFVAAPGEPEIHVRPSRPMRHPYRKPR